MRSIILGLALGAAGLSWAAAAHAEGTEAADPLTVAIHTEDLDRFAELYRETGGTPSADQLEARYLEPGSRGVAIFTPGRIVDAQNLAATVAANPRAYAKAIDTCLPAVREAQADLRSIYLGLRGALPDARLPQVYVVFGAGNSGGTAAPGAQVLGLEVLCATSKDMDELRGKLRHFFAHETVHSIQGDAGYPGPGDDLLVNALAEGGADFIARLVTGDEPDAARAEWASPRERELMAQFLVDIDIVRNGADGAIDARRRWVGNYRAAPEGWPSELGYWIGLRIWERFYSQAEDKHAALQRMVAIRDVRDILATAMAAPASN